MGGRLFSNETLQREDVQIGLFGRRPNFSRDTLKGFRVVRIEVEDAGFRLSIPQASI